MIQTKKYISFQKILLLFWLKDKQGLGLKRSQFACNISKTARDKILRQLRKDKKIYLKQKRYFLNRDFFKEIKQTYEIQ